MINRIFKLISLVLVLSCMFNAHSFARPVIKGIAPFKYAMGISSVFLEHIQSREIDQAYEMLSPAAQNSMSKDEFTEYVTTVDFSDVDVGGKGVPKSYKKPFQLAGKTYVDTGYMIPINKEKLYFMRFLISIDDKDIYIESYIVTPFAGSNFGEDHPKLPKG